MFRFAPLAFVLAACGVRASDGGNGDHHTATDATTGEDAATGDARPPADAAPPCVEGDAHAQNAAGACFAAFTTVAAIRTDAVTACANLGMHLAYPKTADDEQIIATLAPTTDVAIGLDDLTTENQFVWGDGTPLGPYTAWRAGEPNNGNGSYEEDCVVYAGAATIKGWDDRPCAPPPVNTGAYGYICER